MQNEFTKVKSFQFPREILAGHDVICRTAEMCDSFGLEKRALLVAGRKTNGIAGKLVAGILQKGGYETNTIILEEASRTNVEKCKKAVKEHRSYFIIGVGGGSKIDIAKLSAAELHVPYFSIPTSASHDGIASPRASIKDMGQSFSVEAKMPLGIIADTAIIVKSPYRLLASGCADIIANATALKDWELASRLKMESFSRTAYTMSKAAADTIIGKADSIRPGDEESVWVVIRQIIVSGLSMGVAGSSRPTSGSEHLFSHALDMLAPGRALHGEQCGVGTIMMMYLHNGDWEGIRNALVMLKAPATAKGLGFAEKEIVKALTMAQKIRPERYTILGERGLSNTQAEKLAKATCVI